MESSNSAHRASKKELLVDALPAHPAIIERYIQADKVSSEQTAHGLPHAENVRDNVAQLIGFVEEEYPGKLTADDKVCALVAGLLHDNGRAEEIARHGLLGARWTNRFLRSYTLPGDTETFSNDDIKRIVKAVACHSYKEFINVKVSDVVLDLLYIGDKCAGDETRVREDRAAGLAKLSRYSVNLFGKWLRVTWLSDKSREGGEHDRVNYAIKHVELKKDERKLVLDLQIDLRVCDPSLIWSVRWNRSAYKGCWIAAKRLGFEFELQINGVRYVSQGEEADWRAV
jgi:hypothetical protein